MWLWPRPGEDALRAAPDVLTAALGRLADGDRDAFDEVFREARPLLERFAARAAPDDRDELVQRTLIKAFEEAHRYDPRRAGGTWLLALASWEARSLRRDRWRARQRTEGEPSEALPATTADPESQAALAELLDAATACLGALSPQDQEALEAALSAGPNPAGATFRKRLERATRRFLDLWSREHGRDST